MRGEQGINHYVWSKESIFEGLVDVIVEQRYVHLLAAKESDHEVHDDTPRATGQQHTEGYRSTTYRTTTVKVIISPYLPDAWVYLHLKK